MVNFSRDAKGRILPGPEMPTYSADGKIVFRHNKKRQAPLTSTGHVDVGRYCQSCHHPTMFWVDYFCPKCGTHHDQLYGAEREPKGQTSHEAIVAEYEAAGIPFAPSGIDNTLLFRKMGVQHTKDTWEDRRHASTR